MQTEVAPSKIVMTINLKFRQTGKVSPQSLRLKRAVTLQAKTRNKNTKN